MQRYHPASCTSAVNSSAIGGPSARDTVRADSSSLSANFSLNSRRPAPLTPYKLKCEKEGLNSRLGPPDFHPQTINCPEENLTREYVQSGYRETVEGLEESREILLTQVQAFSKHLVVKCKDAIRKRLRAINDSRAQKRKAGQVYGVPLSGSLLTKPGVFPEQRPCGEDFRKKWIEGLSQQHKRLRSLADNVPHGYRKKLLFEVLIRNNVPLLRATWFIKITYLNQARPNSASISCGAFDKAQLSRTDFWTKDVVDYLQCLVDEFFSRGNSHLTMPNKDQSSQMFTVGFSHTKGDPPSGFFDGEEPSLHFKWWYVVRLLLWHQAEGLLLPSLIVDWVLGQLEENDVLEILELLLPIIYGVLETIVLSQTYVRTLVRISVRFIRDSFPGGSDLVDNSRRAYTTSALVEMLRYLILAVPDTFVALDCFPFPPCVVSHTVNDGNFVSKIPVDTTKLRYSSAEVSGSLRSKTIDFQYQSSAFDNVVSSIRKCADNLSKAVSPGFPVCSVAKAVHALDRSLLNGDMGVAYKYLFEDYCNGSIYEGWFEEVSPCLRMSLKWIQTVDVAFVCSVFFLCEWATCDFRDFRSAAPQEMEFTGGKDFSQVYIATRLLKMKARDLRSSSGRKYENSSGLNATIAKGSSQQNSLYGRNSIGSVFEPKRKSRKLGGSNGSFDLFESPGPLHDILVSWIDQHEVQKGEGFKRLQLLIVELTRAGIFYPHSYVRQLIVSGIMDMNGPAVDPDTRRRHHQILKHLPGSFMHSILDDGRIAQGQQLLEVMNVYCKERRLVLQGLVCEQRSDISYANTSSNRKRKCSPASEKVSSSSISVNQLKSIQSSSNMTSSKSVKSEADVEELKEAISLLLRLPNTLSILTDTGVEESIGSAKKSFVSIFSKIDIAEATPGCEDCRRAKKQKLSDEKNSYLHGCSPIPSDDEDMWWVKKGPKSSEALKVDPPVKTSKQVSKGRRKTQSLAHLAASRIEGSQGASTSHVCDNKVTCPHHRSGMEGEATRPVDGAKINHGRDIVSIGKIIKRLRLTEKRAISGWLIAAIRHVVEENEKTAAKAGQFGRPLTSVDDRNAIRWKLGEDQLSAILYLSDVCNDFVSGVKFLLWVLPKILVSSNSTINSRRSILLLPKNVENQVCEVGEAYLLSSLRRYENILVATDLISEALSAIIHRAMAIMASNGRVSGSAALAYARHLLKKYSSMPSVIEWEKSFKATYDKRLITELDPGSLLDGELGPLGVPAGVEDLDDFFRQKIGGGRLSRVGMTMRELVQRQVDEALHFWFGKDRKVSSGGTPKGHATEKSDDGYQIAQKIISGLMECIRHTGGAAQEGDPSLVSSAVSAIVGNLGPTVAKTADFIAGGSSNFSSASGSLDFARRILCIHITCLCLLKEALGERQSRVFEIALATEAFSALAGAYSPGKASRTQFQSLADPHDSNSNVFGENAKVVVGRATKVAAAISALVIGAVIQGVCSLERLVTLFRLKEGLDFIQFVRTTRSNANGNTRTIGMHKIENSIEDYVHWFRLLVGNCRTVFDGLIVELLGEPSIVALFRMQRLLPLSLVLPPAYSIFSFVVWRPFILNSTVAAREDINQLCQSLTMAIGDIVRHLPFRDVCLRDSQGFYNHLMTDSSDVEFAAILELNSSDLPFKSMAFVPLRARLFLNAVIDCKLPSSIYNQDDGSRISGIGDAKVQYSESKKKLLERLVHVLDTLQSAKFHWQWVELRLLLNEQALIEKLETRDMSIADAVRLPSPSPEKAAASDNEKNFIEIILTRLLVRPDAAPLFSDVIHLFGRSLEDSMLLQAKWFLGGQDVLFGRKSIRQRLTNIAESKGLSTKTQFWKPWGWCSSGLDCTTGRGDKKSELMYLEEGEVVEEGTDSRKCGHKSTQILDNEVFHASQQHVTERALIELVLPCIDQSSGGSRNTFANDLIKQLNNIEQQINAVTSGSGKQTGSIPSGIEGPAVKGSNRKMKGGSPGLARRSTSSTDSPLPSPAALRASMSLRIQLILRLLPVILEDREPSGRNMRHMLASVILRLLGNRIVHEDANLTFCPTRNSMIKKEAMSPSEASLTAFSDLPGESLFGRMLLILHALLSSCQPSWLSSKTASKSVNETSKDSTGLVRELADSLQNELDCMQLPDMIRWRIQAAMPIPLSSGRCLLSCQPPTIPLSVLSSFQPSTSTPPGPLSGNLSMPQGSKLSSPRVLTNVSGKSKPLPPQQDYDTEIDPWLLLEDGAGSSQSSNNTAVTGGGEHANFRASYWLKGAVRVRRTDLTYIGAMDDDS